MVTMSLKADLESKYNDVYTTDQVRELFEVHGFLAPWVTVTRKETGEKGTLEFTHSPRFYFNFIKDIQ
jgi:hypothetical protein